MRERTSLPHRYLIPCIGRQRTAVTIITIAAAAMTPVASQPTLLKTPLTANFPIMFLFELMNIIIAITGTATRPLITALQNNALMGSRGENVMAMPLSVAITIVP